jgi:hypothetical protein
MRPDLVVPADHRFKPLAVDARFSSRPVTALPRSFREKFWSLFGETISRSRHRFSSKLHVLVSLARTNQNGETTGCSASTRFPSIDTNSSDRCRRYRKYSSCDHTCCKAIRHLPAATSCISDIEFLDRPGHVRTFRLIPYQG